MLPFIFWARTVCSVLYWTRTGTSKWCGVLRLQTVGTWPNHCRVWSHLNQGCLRFLCTTSLLKPVTMMRLGPGICDLLHNFSRYLSTWKHQWEVRRKYRRTWVSNRVTHLHSFEVWAGCVVSTALCSNNCKCLNSSLHVGIELIACCLDWNNRAREGQVLCLIPANRRSNKVRAQHRTALVRHVVFPLVTFGTLIYD